MRCRKVLCGHGRLGVFHVHLVRRWHLLLNHRWRDIIIGLHSVRCWQVFIFGRCKFVIYVHVLRHW